jgi:hypothetical protein
MDCDYYIEPTLAIEYIYSNGYNLVTKTSSKLKKG